MGSKSVTQDLTDSAYNALAEGSTQAKILGSGNKIGTSDIALYGGSSLTNVTTDHGAVDKALGMATTSLSSSLDFGNSALLFAGQAQDTSTKLASSALETIADMSASQMTNSQSTLKQVGDLAETFRSDGTNRDRTMMYAAGGVLLLAGVFVAYNAWKKPK